MEKKLGDLTEQNISLFPFSPATLRQYTSGGCHLLAYKVADLLSPLYPVSIITIGKAEASYHSAVSIWMDDGEAIVDVAGVQDLSTFKTIWAKILGAHVGEEQGYTIHRTRLGDFYADGITPIMREGLSEEGEKALVLKIAELTEDVEVVAAMVASAAAATLTKILDSHQDRHLQPAPAQTASPEHPR